MASIHLARDLIRIDADPDGLSWLRCPGCHEDLTLDQPDQQLPDRLPPTCAECHAWFLIPAFDLMACSLTGLIGDAYRRGARRKEKPRRCDHSQSGAALAKLTCPP